MTYHKNCVACSDNDVSFLLVFVVRYQIFTTLYYTVCIVYDQTLSTLWNIDHVLIALLNVVKKAKYRDNVFADSSLRLQFVVLILIIEVLTFTWWNQSRSITMDYLHHFPKDYNPAQTTNQPPLPTTTNAFQKTVTWKHFHDSNCCLYCLSSSCN